MKTKIVLFFVFVFSISYGQVTTLGTGMVTQAAAIVDPPPGAPNSIEFLYDTAGNQIVRRFVYIAIPVNPKNGVAPTITNTDYIESDIFSDIKYYPNPVSSELYVQWKNSETNFVERIDLYSLSGQLMRSFLQSKDNEETIVDFQNYPQGFYNLLLVYSNGEAKDLKIIKR